MRNIAVFLCALAVSLVLCASAAAQGLKVVAGTSLIEDVVRDLTGNRAEMLTLIQGSSCPGHDHGKTRDFVFAASADLILVHAFQRHMPLVADMLVSVDNAAALVVLEGKGSWLVPHNQKAAVLAVAEALKAIAPQEAAAIDTRAATRLARVDKAQEESLRLLSPVRGKSVAVANMQEEFVAWAGLRVAASYGRAEDMSARGLAGMVDRLKDQPLSGVVDNVQSGAEAGLPLALELKVPHVSLSNFPGSDESVPDYFSLLQVNTAKLAGL